MGIGRALIGLLPVPIANHSFLTNAPKDALDEILVDTVPWSSDEKQTFSSQVAVFLF